nr:hypothetical protein [Tanacetum cinerariifolium]
VVVAAKLPILNPNEFDLWKMRIEQYFLMTDYSLWEVNPNEQRLAKKNEFKERGTLLMAPPDKHQLKFNIHKDAKSLVEAIEKRFGGNKETKKVQKTLLKQEYENFSGTSSESLDQIHDRLQKLIIQLEILGETISQEDINLKLLRSLPSEWKTHTLIWRNKADLEEQSLDDLFNNLKIYESKVKGSSTSSHNTQNIAFLSSNNTNSTNESVNVVPSVSGAISKAPVSTFANVDSLSDAVIYSFFASQSNSPQLDNEDLKQIDANDLEEIDLKWQMAMLTMRARRRGHFSKEYRSPRDNRNKDTPRRTIPMDVSTSNALVFQCDAVGLESVEARLVVYQQNENVFEEDIKLLKLDVMLRDNALVELRKKFKKAEKERDDLKLTLEKFQTSSKNLKLHSYESDDSVSKSPMNDMYKSGEGYHVVPPPYTGTFMPPKPNLVFNDAPNASETVTNKVKHPKQAENLRTDNQKSKGHKNSWNRKACFVCKSLTHLIKDCDYYEKQMVQKPVWNNAMRCVSAKRTAWNEFCCSMASVVIFLATGRKFNFSKVGKGFSGVDTPLFASMLVQPQAAEEDEEVEVPTAPAPPSPTTAPSPPLQDPTPTPHASPLSPTHEQPTETFESSIPLLNTLLETCATLSQKVVELEQDKRNPTVES